MSAQATAWVLRAGPRPEMRDKTGGRYGTKARGMRAIMLVIADAANAEGRHSHPGNAAIVEGSLYGRRMVAILLGILVDEGWITVSELGGGRGKATVYDIPGVTERVQPVHCFDVDDDPETVQQLLHGLDEKPRETEAETARSEAETARSQGVDQPGREYNGLYNEENTRDNDARRTEFEKWWRAYPRHIGKGAAYEQWLRALSRVDVDSLQTAAERFADHHRTARTEERFIPHASTWLHQHRWQDDLGEAVDPYADPDITCDDPELTYS